MKTVRRIIRGCGYLPACGDHPGTPFLLFCIILGVMAGVKRGSWVTAIVGAGVMLLVFGSCYAVGAYDRAVIQEREDARAQEGGAR